MPGARFPGGGPAVVSGFGFCSGCRRRAGSGGLGRGRFPGFRGQFRKGRILGQGFPSGGALGVRLFGAGAPTQDFLPGQDFHGEYRLVRRAVDGYYMVAGGGTSPALEHFLKPGLGVFRRFSPAAIVGQLRLQRLEDEPAGRLVALVQVNRRRHRLENLLQDGLPPLAAGVFFSFAQGQVFPQGQAPGGPGQAGATDQGRPALGQFSFRNLGQVPVKLGGNHQFEDGIA